MSQESLHEFEITSIFCVWTKSIQMVSRIVQNMRGYHRDLSRMLYFKLSIHCSIFIVWWKGWLGGNRIFKNIINKSIASVKPTSYNCRFARETDPSSSLVQLKLLSRLSTIQGTARVSLDTRQTWSQKYKHILNIPFRHT